MRENTMSNWMSSGEVFCLLTCRVVFGVRRERRFINQLVKIEIQWKPQSVIRDRTFLFEVNSANIRTCRGEFGAFRKPRSRDVDGISPGYTKRDL